jgi:hypothetical protein
MPEGSIRDFMHEQLTGQPHKELTPEEKERLEKINEQFAYEPLPEEGIASDPSPIAMKFDPAEADHALYNYISEKAIPYLRDAREILFHLDDVISNNTFFPDADEEIDRGGSFAEILVDGQMIIDDIIDYLANKAGDAFNRLDESDMITTQKRQPFRPDTDFENLWSKETGKPAPQAKPQSAEYSNLLNQALDQANQRWQSERKDYEEYLNNVGDPFAQPDRDPFDPTQYTEYQNTYTGPDDPDIKLPGEYPKEQKAEFWKQVRRNRSKQKRQYEKWKRDRLDPHRQQQHDKYKNRNQ